MSEDDKSSTASRFRVVPAWITGTYALWTALSGLVAAAGGGASWYLHSITKPVAGEAFTYKIPPNPNVSGDKGRRLVQYEVRNYGPADVHGYKLRVIVPGKYDQTNRTYGHDAKPSRVGSANWGLPEDDGAGAMLVVSPPDSGDIKAHLAAGSSFGIFIDTPDESWEPTKVELFSTGDPINAKNPITAGRFPYLASHWIRDVSPWVSLTASILAAIAFPCMAFWFQARFNAQKDKMEKDAIRRAKESASAGYLDAEKDEDIKQTSKEPAEFKKAAEDARSIHKSDGAPPSPHIGAIEFEGAPAAAGPPSSAAK